MFNVSDDKIIVFIIFGKGFVMIIEQSKFDRQSFSDDRKNKI